MTRRMFVAGATAAVAAPPAARTTMGFSPDCFNITRPPRTALEYLELAHTRGAGGAQVQLASFEPDYLRKVRRRAEELGMYVEVLVTLPDADTAKFEATVKAAKEAGALCMRTACLSGRRYETFATLEAWNAFVADAHQRLARAARIVEKERIALGVENHKDWTADQMAPLMKQFGGEYLGVCIDWGNNISLLDDPIETVETLAPFAVNSHIKDMAVQEYEDGFLLSEVPLGAGMLDLKRMLAAIRKARPNVRFSLDMLTRNPLKVPCLTAKYWIPFPERNGKYLARTMKLVRENRPRKPLQWMDGMSREEQVRAQDANVAQSVDYARDSLGLS